MHYIDRTNNDTLNFSTYEKYVSTHRRTFLITNLLICSNGGPFNEINHTETAIVNFNDILLSKMTSRDNLINIPTLHFSKAILLITLSTKIVSQLN